MNVINILTFNKDNDVEIKDISATNTEKGEKINISWKFVIKDVQEAKIDSPTSCVVKYKVSNLDILSVKL